MRHVLIILLAALLSTCGVRPTLLEEVRALTQEWLHHSPYVDPAGARWLSAASSD